MSESSEESISTSENESLSDESTEEEEVIMIRKEKEPVAVVPRRKPQRGSLLWDQREKSFEAFRSKNVVLPCPEGKDAPIRVKTKTGYALELAVVQNWVIPHVLDKDDEENLRFGLHVSFFHSKTNRFFGNTWVSSESKVSTSSTIEFNECIYFQSDVTDSNCIGVVELVVFQRDSHSNVIKHSYGCGWAILPIFGNTKLRDTTDEMDPNRPPCPFESIPFFEGSPRQLLLIDQTHWQAQDKLKSCKLKYRLRSHREFLKVVHLIRNNEIVGKWDVIPGLSQARLDSSKDLKALGMNQSSLLPVIPTIATGFNLSVRPIRVFVHLREELEENLLKRLSESRGKVFKGVESMEGGISARVLKIGMHNGRCFTSRQQIIALKPDESGGDYLTAQDTVTLRNFSLHPLLAVVMVLQYTIHFKVNKSKGSKDVPDEDVVTVAIAARATVPSDGKKLYFKDASTSNSTTNHHSIQVELCSGATARPYSDSLLYTTPTSIHAQGQNAEVCARVQVELSADGFQSTKDNEEEEEEVPEDWQSKVEEKALKDSLLSKTLRTQLDTTKEPTPPVPVIGQDGSNTILVGLAVPGATELSRASRTLLSRHGFTDILPAKPTRPKKIDTLSIRNELRDPLKGHEISFQFGAYRHAASYSTVPEQVYFTFQFYNSRPTRTENMVLYRSDSAKSEPYILMRRTKKTALKASRVLRFNIDTTLVHPLESSEFAEYLMKKSLRIDVWDGNSLLQIGTATVDLENLLRQGQEFVKFAGEYDVLPPASESENFNQSMNLPTAKVQILMCNFGFKGTKDEYQLEQHDNNCQQVNWRLGAQPDLNKRRPKYRVRARPLFESNQELAQLLESQGFYDDNDDESDENEKRLHKTDATSLSETELDVLCKHFTTGSTRIQYKKGLLQLIDTKVQETETNLKVLMQRAVEKGVNLHESFEFFDQNKSGILSFSEFKQALDRLGFKNLSDHEIQKVISQIDKVGAGGISYKDFVRFFTKEVPVSTPDKTSPPISDQDQLRELFFTAKDQGVDFKASFEHFDKDKRGKITREQLGSGLKELKFQATDEEKLLNAFEFDSDGFLNYSGFHRFIQDPLSRIVQEAKVSEKPLSKVSNSFELQDKTGLVSKESFVIEGISSEEIEIIFQQFKPDEQGLIQLCELKSAIETIEKKWDLDQLRQYLLLQHGESVKKLLQTTDSKITRCEFEKASFNIPSDQLNALFDKKTTLNCAEFASFLGLEWKPKAKDEMRDVLIQLNDAVALAAERGIYITKEFGLYDVENTGFVSKDDMISCLKKLGMTVLPDESLLCQVFESTDSQTETNQIDYRKFLKGVKRSKYKNIQTQEKEADATSALYECTYEFSDVPVLRSAEVKIRRAAIQAAAKGISTRSILHKYDGKRSGELMKTDFVQFLMEIGLAIQDDVHEDGIPIRSRETARQMERLRRFRKDHSEIYRDQKLLMKSQKKKKDDGFAQKKKMLNVLQWYRDGHKQSLVHTLLRQHITTSYQLFPTFGQLLFFEYSFRNPYSHAERFRIEFHDPELKLVLDADEWMHYRKNIPVAVGSLNREKTIEAEMIDSCHELVIESGDQVQIPFTFLTLRYEASVKERVVSVFCKSVAHGHTVALLQLHIHPRPCPIHRTYRFFHPAEGIMKKCLRLASCDRSTLLFTDEPATKYVYCADPNVLVETKEKTGREYQDIFFKFRVGAYPSSAEFFILLYNDRYHSKVHEIWHICIQSMLRLDVHAVMGQNVKNELILKGDQHSRQVKCFTSHPQEIFVSC